MIKFVKFSCEEDRAIMISVLDAPGLDTRKHIQLTFRQLLFSRKATVNSD